MFGKNRELVAGLFVLEIAILGAIVYFLGSAGVSAAALQSTRVDFDAGTTVATLDAGQTPAVIVRDRDSHVVVTASADGLVHVTDKTRMHGFLFGTTVPPQPLRAVRTAPDTVTIERSGPRVSFVIGYSSQRIEIAVPPGARLDVRESSATDVTGLRAALKVRSQDGHIGIFDTDGDIDIATNDGHIELQNVHAAHILAHSDDGHIVASNIRVDGSNPSAKLQTNSGSIRASGTLAEDGRYTFDTNDGRITAGFAGASALAIDASTADGSIIVDGRRIGSGDGSVPYHSAGTGSGSLELSTQDGRITLNTSGAIQL